MNIFSSPGCNIVDFLCTAPSPISFPDRVRRLQLGNELERRILDCYCDSAGGPRPSGANRRLSPADEQELATEILSCRYSFTRCLLKNGVFRQAALSVIQNIYLFRNRHIFFRPSETGESERRQALELFSGAREAPHALPVAMTLQHPVLARIWARIAGGRKEDDRYDPDFLELHAIVEKLNTLRNIYMLFCFGLVRKLARKIGPVYRQSVTYEDAVQIGSFGVARAAYRYHPSCGLRFSTYAVNWIFKEHQRQALEGRLIRISSNVVERYSLACRRMDTDESWPGAVSLLDAVPVVDEQLAGFGDAGAGRETPERLVEERRQRSLLLREIETKLSPRSGDIIRRRYGLVPYGGAQSIISIAEEYGLTRGRVYQIEQEALARLRKSLLGNEVVGVFR